MEVSGDVPPDCFSVCPWASSACGPYCSVLSQLGTQYVLTTRCFLLFLPFTISFLFNPVVLENHNLETLKTQEPGPPEEMNQEGPP